MSATTDRLDQLEAQTAPLPWPVHDFYDLPDDQFQMLYALSQAWPLLRREILELEAAVVSLGKENAALHAEHRRVVGGATALGRELGELRERHGREKLADAEAYRVLGEQRDELARSLASMPLRTAAAEAVCASLETARKGSGGAYGWYDGEAHDAWKKAREGT